MVTNAMRCLPRNLSVLNSIPRTKFGTGHSRKSGLPPGDVPAVPIGEANVFGSLFQFFRGGMLGVVWNPAQRNSKLSITTPALPRSPTMKLLGGQKILKKPPPVPP